MRRPLEHSRFSMKITSVMSSPTSSMPRGRSSPP
ncbi:unnamed protein product [Staurois parvus]|uniref:Uncharacterized protein n=1 Tax=Staurois parvus TaxID=386267 RepID=A0ABN9G6Y4_9NEOB|nr:unnamed protein product [Staurois parvus]